MIPLTLCWLTVPTASPIELIDAAATAGFSSAAMRVVESGANDISFVGENGADVPAIRRAAAAHGIGLTRCAGFRLDGRAPRPRYLRFVEAAAELGVRYISAIGNDTHEERAAGHFAELCDCAAEFGLVATIEFAPFTAVRTVADAQALIRRSARANAAILVDTMHLVRAGGSADDLRQIPRSLLSVVQICDGPLKGPEPSKLQWESRHDRFDPGEGELPLEEMLDALPADLPAEIEVPSLAQRDLPPADRARKAAFAAEKFFAACRGWQNGR